MKTTRKYIAIALLMIFTVLFVACGEISTSQKTDIVDKHLEVHYIDVGQGDAIFIQQGGNHMLIDAGDNQQGQRVVEYLESQGIKKLDYVIGTHPHADHIGGLDEVIHSFEVGTVIMPRVSHNTKTFEDVLLAIQEKQLKITTPNVGDTYALGDAVWTVIAPSNEDYESLNDYSVGILLKHDDTSFMFTGDAQEQSESEMLDLSPTISLEADVLKLPHHGSSTSTTDEFLNAVNPSYGVIQLAEDNSYGHPHKEIIEKLEKYDIETYRTDIHGDVIAISDGKDIEFQLENSYENQEENSKNTVQTYIGNKNTNIFHDESCNQLPSEENRVYFQNKKQATNQGYRPHQGCLQ